MNALAAMQTAAVPTSIGPVWNVRKRNTPTAWSYQAVVYEPAPPPPGKGLLPVWRERERLGKPAPLAEDAALVGNACGLTHDVHARVGEPILTAATVHAALGAALGPEAESAWRLGADYKVIAVKGTMKGIRNNEWRYAVAIAKDGRHLNTKKRGAVLFDGRLICRLGSFSQADLRNLANSGLGYLVLDHMPQAAEPERTPAEDVAHAAAKKNRERTNKRRELEARIKTWQRKLALAKTKVKQYTSKLKRLDRGMAALP